MTGITAQTAVVAFQCAAGFSDCVIPTSSTTNACIGAGGISFVQWFRFAIKLALYRMGTEYSIYRYSNVDTSRVIDTAKMGNPANMTINNDFPA